MTSTDTMRHALDLLDRAVLMRMDPNPVVALRDVPESVEPDSANPELYLDMLHLVQQAASHLGSLGWHLRHRPSDCLAPHLSFTLFEWALLWASPAAERRGIRRLDMLLDGRGVHGEAFRDLHRSLDYLVRDDASASCSSIVHQKL